MKKITDFRRKKMGSKSTLLIFEEKKLARSPHYYFAKKKVGSKSTLLFCEGQMSAKSNLLICEGNEHF